MDKTGKEIWRPVAEKNKPLKNKNPTIQEQLSYLKTFRFYDLTPCNRFRYVRVKNKFKNHITTKSKHLTSAYNDLNPIHALSVRQTNYINRLRIQIGTDLTPKDIITYGERELAKSTAALNQLENEIIKNGIAPSLQIFEQNIVNIIHSSEDIIAQAESRSPIIAKNMSKLFYDIRSPRAALKPV